jgi:hypothetical protein
MTSVSARPTSASIKKLTLMAALGIKIVGSLPARYS